MNVLITLRFYYTFQPTGELTRDFVQRNPI